MTRCCTALLAILAFYSHRIKSFSNLESYESPHTHRSCIDELALILTREEDNIQILQMRLSRRKFERCVQKTCKDGYLK